MGGGVLNADERGIVPTGASTSNSGCTGIVSRVMLLRASGRVNCQAGRGGATSPCCAWPRLRKAFFEGAGASV